LTLTKDFHEIAHTDFFAIHQVQRPEAGPISKRGKQQSQVVVFREMTHSLMIYALTDMSRGEYIRFSICKGVGAS
ncbi:MAG: hypothetical protein WA869_28095, partial [Alloacidobacterium sp.]